MCSCFRDHPERNPLGAVTVKKDHPLKPNPSTSHKPINCCEKGFVINTQNIKGSIYMWNQSAQSEDATQGCK